TEKGPVLIEIAARVSGGTDKTNADSTGFEQVELTVDAYVDPDRFTARTKVPYIRSKHFYEMFLSSPQRGIITGKESFEKAISELPSYSKHNFSPMEGEIVPK